MTAHDYLSAPPRRPDQIGELGTGACLGGVPTGGATAAQLYYGALLIPSSRMIRARRVPRHCLSGIIQLKLTQPRTMHFVA